MDYFAGLDVSVKETSVCIVDSAGMLVREVRVASEPEALLQVLRIPGQPFKRIGLEAGPLSQWLFSALAEAGLPVICVETRHMRAVLKAQINKTDRNDARGMAQMMRVSAWTYRRRSAGNAAPKIVPLRPRTPCWKGLGADSEEKREPVSDINTAMVDSLKALDSKRPIREADIRSRSQPQTLLCI